MPLGKFLFPFHLGQLRRLLVFQGRYDIALHIGKGFSAARMVFDNASRNQRVGRHFDGVGIALIAENIKAIEGLNDALVNQLVFVVARNPLGGLLL